MAASPPSTNPSQYLEEQKVAFDFVKLLTTLTTGTIVLLTTFAKEVFKNPAWQFLIPVAFSCFAVATISLVLAAFGLLWSIRHAGRVPPAAENLTVFSTLIGMLTFGGGLVSLSAFATKNWS
jgi:hypothetical protein